MKYLTFLVLAFICVLPNTIECVAGDTNEAADGIKYEKIAPHIKENRLQNEGLQLDKETLQNAITYSKTFYICLT